MPFVQRIRHHTVSYFFYPNLATVPVFEAEVPLKIIKRLLTPPLQKLKRHDTHTEAARHPYEGQRYSPTSITATTTQQKLQDMKSIIGGRMVVSVCS
jgi:hypothetical protein